MAFNDGYNPPVSCEPFWRIGGSSTKWECREEINCTITEISALGLDGWELAGIYPDTSKTYLICRFFFKRPMATISGEWQWFKRACCGANCLYSEVTIECSECAAKCQKAGA